MSTASRVVSLYRKILRTSRTWSGPQNEKDYIRKEAQTLFRANRDLKDPKEINEKILEGENRLEIGVHYKIPYPRLHHKIATFHYHEKPEIDFSGRRSATSQAH